MSELEDSIPEELRARVLAAAYDELTRWGIDRFRIVSLADRHGLDPREIRQRWGDERGLILDVFVSWALEDVVVPDTGHLRSDLFALTVAIAAYIESETGRNLQVTRAIRDPELPTAAIRQDIWRERCDSLRAIVDRAQERGELRDGLDAPTVLELLFAPINMRALFTGEPIDEEYCRTISDLVWRAVTSAPPGSSHPYPGSGPTPVRGQGPAVT